MRTAAVDRFWYSFQAFLVAAGNISKLLWPAYLKGEKLIPERGPDLRASLEVGEDSPLRSRALRNHFEHFDTLLKQWAVSSNPRSFSDLNIVSASILSSSDPRDNLRNFDPHTFIVPFRGESYHVLPLVEAAEQLWHRATVLAQRRASA
jgi:hypothetical protein